jgi:hypothetical protein
VQFRRCHRSIGLAGRSLPKFLLSALYQRCNNQDILSWRLVSFEPRRLLPLCRISRGIRIQRRVWSLEYLAVAW